MSGSNTETRNYVISGPGIRMRTVEATMVVVGNSGDLQMWSTTHMIRAYAAGEWSTFWIEDNAKSKS